MAKTYDSVIAEIRQRQEKLTAYCSQMFANELRITLEIGCGHGHFLAAYAQAHPAELCIGIDLVTKRIEKGILKKSKNNIERLHFIKADF